MRQLHCNAKSAFQTQVPVTFFFILNVVFSGVCLTGSWFCTLEKFGIDLVLVSFSVVPPVCQQRAAFCFIEEVVPLNFGFYSLGNEQNF